jgi:hypothetical protein
MNQQIASPTAQQNMEGSHSLYLMHDLYIVPKERAHNSHPPRKNKNKMNHRLRYYEERSPAYSTSLGDKFLAGCHHVWQRGP